jgi:hypothetical protein
MTDISEAGANFVRDLGEAARQNPISAALIGMGVVWMLGGGEAAKKAGAMLGGSNRDLRRGASEASDYIQSSAAPAKSAANSMGSAMTAAAQNVGDSASSPAERASEFGGKQAAAIGNGIASAAQNVGESAASALGAVSQLGRKQAGAISEYAQSIPDAGAGLFGNVRSNMSELFRTQPLALGAVGLAIGAGIAAALPVSEIESTYLGEASDTAKKKASDLASEQAKRAKDVAKDAMDAASEEVRRQATSG